MIEWLQQIGLFSAQVILIVLGILVVMTTFFSLLMRNKQKPDLEIEHINENLEFVEKTMKAQFLNKKSKKEEEKKEKKERKKKNKESSEEKPRIFVIDFEGDMKASATDSLREEITAVLTVARPEKDELLVNIESPGGVVHGYGLAASQLERVRNKKIPLTVCIDKVAASGGYMMACVANKILSAPFAIVGSVGVVAQIPNFHRLLKKNNIDVEVLTAGEYKRTLTLLGENTEDGRKKFIEQLEDTHKLFKEHISRLRSQVDIQKISTGEYWYGRQALELKLVDEVQTSDDYLLGKNKTHEVYKITYSPKKSLGDKLSKIIGQALTETVQKLLALMPPSPRP